MLPTAVCSLVSMPSEPRVRPHSRSSPVMRASISVILTIDAFRCAVPAVVVRAVVLVVAIRERLLWSALCRAVVLYSVKRGRGPLSPPLARDRRVGRHDHLPKLPDRGRLVRTFRRELHH